MNAILTTKRGLLLALVLSSFTAVFSSRADQAFDWTNLVSDINGITHQTDGNLVNPWGIAPGLDGTFWVANNHTGTITVYDGRGNPWPRNNPLVVTVPPPSGSPVDAIGAPTGLVLNPVSFGPNAATDFVISSNSKSGPSVYLTATEDGTIAGYNYKVDGDHAIIAVDHSALGAIYKGLALGWDSQGHHRLYAANFHAGLIEVFDSQFQPAIATGGFIDPSPVAGYAPFNLISVPADRAGTMTKYLIVAYAKQDATAEDEEAGAGFGFINVFDADGKFIKRLVPYFPPESASPVANQLNAPWGMTVARPPFGRSDGTLVVGNFGDGTIQRFSLADLSGVSQGALTDRDGNPLRFDGLWGLAFAVHLNRDGSIAGRQNVALYFAAGISDEDHGLFGVIVHRR